MVTRYCSVVSCLKTALLCALVLLFSQNLLQGAEKPKGKIENLMLKNLDLQKVARLLSEGSGRTIIVSSKAADTKVSVFLESVSTIDAIKSICRAYHLWYKEDKDSGIIEITTLEDYRRTADIYSDEVLEVVPIMYPQAQKIGDVIKDIFQDRVVWTSPGDADYISDRMGNAMGRMYMIKDAVREDYDNSIGTNANGYNNGYYNNGYNNGYSNNRYGSYNNGYAINNYNNSSNYGGSGGFRSGGSNRKDIKSRTEDMTKGNILMKSPEDLKNLDGMQLQALEEKRRRRTFAEIVGRPGSVYVSAMVETNSLVLRSLDRNAVERIKRVIKQLDKPTSQVLLELKILDVSIGREKALGVDWLFDGLGDHALGRVTALPSSSSLSAGSSSLTADLNSSGNSNVKLKANIAALDPRIAVFTVVSDALDFRIKAMEQDGSLTVLGTPTLIVADGEASQLFVGKESTILTAVRVERSTRGDDEQFTDTTVTPTTERVNLGTSLFITPQIHADKTVTIRIFHKNSQLGDEKEIRYGGSDESYFVTQDVDSRSVTTTAIASDGKIVAVSGLISESQDNSVRKVPLVSKIPVVGKLFTSRERNNSRSELIVLMRPYVLIAPDQAQKVTMDFLKRASIHPSAKDDLPELGVGRVGDGGKSVLDDKNKFLDEEIEDWVRDRAKRNKIYKSGGECMEVTTRERKNSKLLAKASMLEKTGKSLDAVGAYKEIVAESQNPEEKNAACMGAARSLMAIGKNDAALMALDDFTATPGSKEERMKLSLAGEILLRMNNSTSAESTLELALAKIDLSRSNPQWLGTVCANLGRTYLLNRKPDKARKVYQLASKAFSAAGDVGASQDCKAYSEQCLQ